MMSSLSNCVQDQGVCDACEHLFSKKDKIIDDLKRNLQSREDQVEDLENEVKKLQKHITITEKVASELQSVEGNKTNEESEKNRNLELLRNQLKYLEEEKKYLNEKIHDFEHETAGLARMFGVQQEKFEYDIKSKDELIKSIEKERKRFEGELEKNRSELEKLRNQNESEKALVENLKTTIQEKDQEVLNLSHLHNETKKLLKEVEEKFTLSDENLKNERSKNKVLEQNVSSCMDDIEILNEEINHLRNGQTNVNEEKSRVEKEIQMLNDHIECLQNKVKESRNTCAEMEECNSKLKQDKNDKESQIRNLEKKDIILREEIVLLTDQKHALETKIRLVQEEIKNVKISNEKLEQQLFDSHERLKKAEENLEKRTIEKNNLEDGVEVLEQAINDLTIKYKEQNESLEKVVKELKNETKEKERLEEAMKALDQVINDLKNNSKQQNIYVEKTKRELDTVLGTKQQLSMKVEKLEDFNKDLKIKVNTLSEEIENMNGICNTKANKIENLEESVNEKSRIILLHEKKEKELQNHIEELLNMDEIRTNELKNVKEAITKLRTENANIEENLEKITVQFQECLQELSEKNELYMESRTNNEKQVEELSRFRELNAEINNELKNRNDEISLLHMEKDELLKELKCKQDLIEKNSSIQSSLSKEVESIKTDIEKYKENEKGLLQKLSDAKRKHETAMRHCDNERDEKNDLTLQLKYSREKSERWKKLSFEVKEERNRLQMQIAELDRNLNEKHSNLAEEKSSLEKEMETLKNVVKRLKSNEENLRGKIEELRDEVNKLSDINSEQEMEIRKLSWEKEKMTENLVRLKSVVEENFALQNECKEINQENVKLKNDKDTMQEKARNVGDENEKLQKEVNFLQDQFDVMQSRVLETTQECKQLKSESDVLKDSISELLEEKERLSNENFRLKEKKSSIIEDRNKLQDMIESLDKCHSEKNDELSQQNALLHNELESRRLAVKKCEEKESKLLNEIQELNAKIEKSTEENDKINGLFRKTDGENIRLRKKVAELGKLVEQIEQERESRIYLQTELNEKEQLLNKYKESKITLNDLISTLYRQQNELKDVLRIKERELSDLNNVLGTERSDKLKFKDMINQLKEELKTTKTREQESVNAARNEKEKYKQAELALGRVKKERNDLKETSRRNEDGYNKTIQNLESEIQELLDKICMLENDNNEKKLCSENLDNEIRNLKEEIDSLAETKSQSAEEIKKKNEQLGDLAKDIDTLKEENRRLQEQADNINKTLYLQNSAALDQASGMGKEINILHDTLTELRNIGDMNRAEIDDLKKKLNSANEDKMNTKTKLDSVLAEREKLESKNNELLSNCARLENVVKEGAQAESEKDDMERRLKTELQKNRILSEEITDKNHELSEKEQVLTNLKKELSDHKETIEKLNITNEGLVDSVEELTQINEEGLKDFTLTSDKNEQLLCENKHLTELVTFHKDEAENLQRETDRIKTDLQAKFQEAENDKLQMQSDVNMKDENFRRLTEKNSELLEKLKNAKDEVDDLENENEDLSAEIDQLKEVNKKVKEVLCSLQSDHGVLQEELREKENKWNEEKEKTSLKAFKMETDIKNLNDRITKANERNEKQRELEKMLRFEIDELSDGYVELEEDVQHRNDDNLSLREKIQTLSQDIEELELSRDTACLLKEKRHCELLKSEKNTQRLEKQLKEKQKTNKKLQKELDSATEKENFLKLQISSEKEMSSQRLKQIQDMQNSQRQVDEHLWKAKRDIEKLETEIETWRTSSDSMKVRINTLEDELSKTENEKHVISELYKESKVISETTSEEILTLKSNFAEKTIRFETIVGEMNNENTDLNKTVNDLEGLIDKKSVEVKTLKESVQILNNKYEDSLLMVSLLHNDIQGKEERITDLEERRKIVTNSLMNLDLKIEEIQVQAERLETDNEFLRQQLARSITSEEDLKQALENEQQIFTEKYERKSQKMKHIQKIKDHYAQRALEAKGTAEDKNNALLKLQANYDKLVSDKHCLNNTKERLENELWETKLQEEKLKQTLDTEKEKTLRQSLQIEQLLKDVECTRAKCSKVSEEHKETENKLIKTKVICEKQEASLKERKAEISIIREDCENWKHKANRMEESLSDLTKQNEKIQQKKNEEIRLLTAATSKLNDVLDDVKSKLDEQTTRNNTNELENESLKEKLEQREERLNDLEVSYKKILNLKNSLEVDKKGLLAKLNTSSRNLQTLKTAKQQLITENKDLNGVIKAKEEEFEKVSNTLQVAQQKSEKEIFNHKTTLDNLLVENIDLRKKVSFRDTQLKETTKSLQEISCTLEDQEKENKRLKLEMENLNFERNCLADVNVKVSDALGKLTNESGRNEKQHESKPLESDKQSLDEHGDCSWQARQLFAMRSFELQNKLIAVENEIFTLRSLVSDKEYKITRLQESLESLQKEMDAQCLQASNYKRKAEDEYNRRKNTLDTMKQLEADLEQSKKEKCTISTELEGKLMHMQHEILGNETVICTLREKNAKLDDSVREMKALDEEKTEQIKKLEREEITRKSEQQAVDKLMQKIFVQIWNLEEALQVFDGQDATTAILCTDEYNRMDKYRELLSTLMSRFEQVLSSIQSHLQNAKKLEEDLNDAESQSSVYRAELQASETSFTNLKIECEQLHNQLSIVTSSRDEALDSVAQLSESLLTAEKKIERARILQCEENSKISQELQKMQRELTLVCEKFNCSIAKVKSQEEKLDVKEKRIVDLEESVKVSSANERVLQMKIAELETTSEILLDKNNELENIEKKYEGEITVLKQSLQQEKAGQLVDIAERAATIRQLELKNENLQKQVVRSKELLVKSEKTIKELQKELETLQSRHKDSETARNAEIADCKTEILQLQHNILNLEEDNVCLRNDKCVLTKTKEYLLENISNVEKENNDFRNILEQNKQEKEIQNKSLGMLLNVALNEELSNDCNDQSMKLERVIEVIAELRNCQETLTKEKKDILEHVSTLTKENEEIHMQNQTHSKDNKLLKQHSNQLTDKIKKLENDLVRSKSECKQLNVRVQELEENVDTLKVTESQQHYQYHVLEKEKEDLESEMIYIEEGMEKLTEKLNQSVEFKHNFQLDTISDHLDDSGIGTEDNSARAMSSREQLDSGVFSPNLDKSTTFSRGFKSEDENVGNDKMKHLETAIATCVQMMSKVSSTLSERSKLFSIKEQNFIEEISTLKQASAQNENLLSSLEEEVERLEFSQTTLQETYQEKDENLKKCQMKLEHSITIADQKEMSITILQESVQEYKKQQEFLETEINKKKMANEQLHKEKEQAAITIQGYEKTIEEHRQQRLESDAENKKKTKGLRIKISELENQILEQENAKLELSDQCAILNGNVDELNNREREHLSSIASCQDQVKNLEKEKRNISEALDKSKKRIVMLEFICQEKQESVKDLNEKLQKASVVLEESRRDVAERNEENVRIKLDRDSLEDKAKIRKEQLKEKKSKIEHMSSELREKDELLRKNDTKLKLVEEFLQEINKSKDCLEKEFRKYEKENGDLREHIEELKEENNSLSESISRKEQELIEKDNLNCKLDKEINEIKNKLVSNKIAFQKMMEKLRISLGEAKRIKNVIDDLSNLFGSNNGYQFPEEGCLEEMDIHNVILSTGKSLNNLTLLCQKGWVERDTLQKNVENIENEKAALQREKHYLNDKASTLSKAFVEVKSSLRKQEQELDEGRNELRNEKKKNDDLRNVNVSFKEQIRILEEKVLSISVQVESLQMDRKNLKESLLKAQDQEIELRSKHEHLDVLNDKLRTAEQTINELNYLQKETINEKEDAEKEIKYTQQRLAEQEKLQEEQTKLLSDIQITLTQERERIVTLTKLARIKEHDLENAKVGIKLKDELITQMKDQIEEMKGTSLSTKEELAKVAKQLTTVQQQKETCSNEKVSLWKDCVVLKDRLEQMQTEKQKLEIELDSEKKAALIASENLEKQMEIINDLRIEVKRQKQHCEHLENEKSKIKNEAKDKEKSLELECEELLEKYHTRSKSFESTLLHVKSELSLSESLRSELEQRISGNDIDSLALQNQNLKLQAEIETCTDTIKKQSDRVNNLITENNDLKESVRNISDESERLKNRYNKTKEQLEIMRTTLAEKERENDVLQKEILSGKEIIYTLRNVDLNSKSEMNELKCKALEITHDLEKVNKELAHERNTVSMLIEDKANLEELYQISQNQETNMRKKLQDTKLQINEIRNDNLTLRKENASLHCTLEQSEKTIKDLKFDIQVLSVKEQEINNKLTEARQDIEKANRDLNHMCSVVGKISSTTKTILNEIHADASKYNLEISCQEEQDNDLLRSPPEATVERRKSAVNTLFEDLRTLDIALKQIDSSLKHLLEGETALKNDINELTQINKILNDQNERQKEKVKTIQEDRNNFLQKNEQLQTQNKELTTLCEKRKEECKTVEELLSNECTITTEMSNELSTLKDKEKRLREKNNELEENFDQYMKENADLNAKHEALKQEIRDMCEKYSSLERNYSTLCQEKRKSDEKSLKSKEHIVVLEKDLEASVEFSELLEKRFAEESENNTKLLARVETLDDQIFCLENNLKRSLSQIEETNAKVVLMEEEIHQTTVALGKKESEIARLQQEFNTNNEELTKSTAQVENYKTAYEDTLKCENETKQKLEQADLQLKRAEEQFHSPTMEKNDIEKELQLNIKKLKERVDELTSELSTTVTNEEATRDNLHSARDTVKQLEKDLKEKLLVIKDCEKKRKAKDDELYALKMNYTSTKTELGQTCEENEALKQNVKRLETEITLQSQESQQKLKETENLKVQLASQKKAKQNLQNEMLTLQKKLDFLEKQKNEKEKEIECIMRNKTVEVDQISTQLQDEMNKTEELQSKVNAAVSEKEKLEQVNDDVCQDVLTSCQSLVRDLKSTELGKSCNDSILEDSHGVADFSKIIGMVHSTHTLIKNHNYLLNTKITELKVEMRETEKENETLLAEKAQLNDDLHSVQKESAMIQVNCNSLANALETCQHDIELKGKQIQTLESEINEFKQTKQQLQETIEIKNEKSLVLQTKMEALEEKRASFEDEVSELQRKLGNTIIELTTANTTNEILKSKNSELIYTNSRLLDDQTALKSKLNAVDKNSEELLKNIHQKENQLSKLTTKSDKAEQEKSVVEKCLEEKETELSQFKDNLNELESQKHDLEEKIGDLKEIHKQTEKDYKDLQLTIAQLQADNAQLRREDECKRNTISNLQCDLEEALILLKKQHNELYQVQNEKHVVQSQLLEAEKELRVLMEDNANRKHQMYQTAGQELLTTRCEVSRLKCKEATLTQENKYLADQLREKSEELEKLKLKEQKVTRGMENNREQMRRYLNDRDKWEEQVKSVISEISQQ